MQFGDLDKAEEELQQALDIYKRKEDRSSQVMTIVMLGELRAKERKYCDAKALFDQAMTAAENPPIVYLVSAIKEDQKKLGPCKASSR